MSDVVVIGGGIIGCSAAAMIAKRGASVTLVETTAVGAGASGRNMGVLQHPFDPLLGELYRETLVRCRELAQADPDFDLPDAPSGLLLLNPDPAAARAQVDRLTVAAPELRPTFLDVDAVASLEPSLVPGQSACRLETGMPIPPASATAGYARLAEARGVGIRIGSAAQPWLDGERVRGVMVDDGTWLAADQVLLAAGPWTPEVLGRQPPWPPIGRTWGVTVQVELGAASPRHVLEEDHVDAINRPVAVAAEAVAAEASAEDEPLSIFTIAAAGGVATIGSTFLPSEPDATRVAALLVERGAAFLPALAAAPVIGIRRCARPQSVDGRPFIGTVPGIEGLYVCAGHGPWGISTGPATAALVVGAMLDGAPIPAEFRADRVPARATPLTG